MRKLSMIRIASLIVVTMFIAVSPSHGFAETINELQSEYDQAQQNIHQTKEQLDANKTQQNNLLSQIDGIDKRLVSINAEVLRLRDELTRVTKQREETERQLAVVQASLDKTLKELADAKKQLDKYKSILNERIKNVYMNGKASFMEVVLKSTDFNDLINRVAFLQLIAEQDSRLVKETQQLKATIEAKEVEQEKQKNDIEVKRATILAEEHRIAYLKEEQDRQKAGAEAEINQRQVLVEQLKQDQTALEEMQAQEEAEAERLAARIRGWGYIVVSRTGWVWPTGTMADITSYFGPRPQPMPGASTDHKGIDIAVDYGTPVVAANNGVVEDAGWLGTYGLYVGINHGDGIASAYAHLSAVAVDPGQEVKAGQVIGYVGSTGNSTGPHLHFEILVDGIQQNPLNWF